MHNHSERSELGPVTPEYANPQAQRAKQAVLGDPRICKSTGTVSEPSNARWLSNLQIPKHSERGVLCPAIFKYVKPQAHRAIRAFPSGPRICKSTSTASEASYTRWPSNMLIGARPVEDPYIITGQILTIVYFLIYILNSIIFKLWEKIIN